MKRINVLIVDDSAFMRKLISDFLSEDSRIHVIGTARNGEDGIKKISELKPDVVTMDIEMPVLNGLDALKLIMKTQPVPVVMLSSTTKIGTENTLTAIEYGAVDFIAKPSGAISLDLHKIKEELKEKVILASKANFNFLSNLPTHEKRPTTNSGYYSKIESNNSIVLANEDKRNKSWNPATKKIICIGTSTGGPRALQNVLTKLPSNIDAAILIVQHMPPVFTKSLADRLDKVSDISIKEAENGEIVKKGTAYIAPGGFHFKVNSSGNNLVVHLDQGPPKNGHRPSVDVLFESASNMTDYSKIAVIMTGMGSDGANGLNVLKKNGDVKAIAESEETSIVFGMPKAAIATGLIDEVNDVNRIAESIMKYV